MKALAFSGGKDSMACLHLLRDELDCAIYVDSGYSYPETRVLVSYAASMVTMVTVDSDRRAQNEREGIPADVVPVDWTRLGQTMTGAKDVMIQSYLGCCFENLYQPLMEKAKALGVTKLYIGQRASETHKSPLQSGVIVEGIERVYPIEDWSEEQVLAYLAEKMEVPEHYYRVKHSSLDCFDCTAYRMETKDRVAWTREKYPEFHRAYFARAQNLASALAQATGD